MLFRSGTDPATLLFVNQSLITIGNSLQVRKFQNPANCSGGKEYFPEIGDADSTPAATKFAPVRVEPNRPMTLFLFGMQAAYVNGASGQRSCDLILSFTPKSNQRYTIAYSLNGTSCSGGIVRWDNGQWVKEESTRQRKPILGPDKVLLPGSAQCE